MDRKTYMREYMRTYRANRKTIKPGGPHRACDVKIAELQTKVMELTKELAKYRKDEVDRYLW